MNRYFKNKGYVALISISIIMAILIVFLTGAQYMITSGLQSGLTDRLSIEAYSIAESCYEDSLIILRSDSTYTGGCLNLADGYCTIQITDTSLDTKNIKVEGSTLNTYFQTIEADIQIIEGADTKQIIIQNKQRY